MGLYKSVKDLVGSAKRLVTDDSLDSLLSVVNIFPTFFGYSFRKERIFVPYWVVHLSLVIYLYAIGTVEYQWRHAQGTQEFVKSYVNINILFLVSNNSWWFLQRRILLKSVLKDIALNDRMALQSGALITMHAKNLRTIKRIIFVFLGFNLADAYGFHLPHRLNLMSDNAITPCFALDPLEKGAPNKEICLAIIGIGEISIMTVVLSFQTMLLVLIAHTAVMYQMLASEIMLLSENKDTNETKALAKEILPIIVTRHSLTMKTVDKLKYLYNVPLGINFGINAVCLTLFFYLPLYEWVQFMAILVYSVLVFFLYCFLGQRLINASEEFEKSVYCCGWENFDLKEKRMIYVMLRQAQKPITLLAADIIPVNIYTFATTLQGVFKFVTVVKV